MMTWIYLFMENKDALMALPAEVKMILMGCFAFGIGYGIIKKFSRLLKYAIIGFVLYVAATQMGVI